MFARGCDDNVHVEKTVYFVGAGFTKALQHRQPVPMMMDFVHVMCHYADRDDVVLMALIALEAMDCYEHRDPVLRALADDRKPKRHSREMLDRIRRRPAESIEKLLSTAEEVENRLDRESPEILRAAIYSPVKRASFAINRMFRSIGWALRTKPLLSYLRNRCSSPNHRHTFVSFNYDLALEHVLEQATSHWSPKAGYGLNLRWGAINDPDDVPGPDLVPLRGGRSNDVIVLKPHGSLNWLLDDRHRFHLPFISLTEEGRVRYIGTKVTHPYVSLPDRLPIAVSPFIVPPTSKKNTNTRVLQRIRQMETDALAAADEVFVIGWSVPSTDEDQVALIKHAVSQRSRPLQRLVVVNYAADTSYYDQVARIFRVKPRVMSVFDTGLQDFLSHERGS